LLIDGCGTLAITMFNFEKLEVWQKSIALADVIYHETRSFPVDERFGLTNQMRRSVVSVSSNIAEGSSRSSKTISDALLRLGRAPSLNWFLSRLSPSDKTSCQKENFQAIYSSADEIGRMLSGLRASLDRQ